MTQSNRLSVWGWLICVAFFTAHLSASWEWSFLIDDLYFVEWIPKAIAEKGFYRVFLDEVALYWEQGRFFPTKYVFNLLKWGYLPLWPALFFWINFVVVFVSLAFGALADGDSARKWCWFLLGLGFLQRQIMDAAALNSISDGWVILFLGAGLWAFPRPILYRLFFVLCVLAKEPGFFIFLSTAAWHAYEGYRGRQAGRAAVLNAAIDLSLFLALGAIMLTVKYSADASMNYTGNYSYLASGNILQFAKGLARCLVALAPVIALLVWFARQPGDSWRKFLPTGPVFFLGVSFAVFYMIAAVPRGLSGYVLVPPSFAFAVALMAWAAKLLEMAEFTRARWAIFSGLIALILVHSLVRYNDFHKAINESTRAMHHLVATSNPRLVIVNSDEGAAKARLLADSAGAPQVKYLFYQNDDQAIEVIQNFQGEIVLFELSYFDRYNAHTVEALGAAVGGWKQNFKRRPYQYFFGSK